MGSEFIRIALDCFAADEQHFCINFLAQGVDVFSINIVIFAHTNIIVCRKCKYSISTQTATCYQLIACIKLLAIFKKLTINFNSFDWNFLHYTHTSLVRKLRSIKVRYQLGLYSQVWIVQNYGYPRISSNALSCD